MMALSAYVDIAITEGHLLDIQYYSWHKSFCLVRQWRHPSKEINCKILRSI